jgi:hypothetical protein
VDEVPAFIREGAPVAEDGEERKPALPGAIMKVVHPGDGLALMAFGVVFFFLPGVGEMSAASQKY